jgi:hypothetical protein
MSAAASPAYTPWATPISTAELEASAARHAAREDDGDFKKVYAGDLTGDSFDEKIKALAFDSFNFDVKKYEDKSFRPLRFASWRAVVAEFESYLRWRVPENARKLKDHKGASSALIRFSWVGCSPTEAQMKALLARLEEEGDLALRIKSLGAPHAYTNGGGATFFAMRKPKLTKKGVVLEDAGLQQIAVAIGCVSWPIMTAMASADRASMAGPTV